MKDMIPKGTGNSRFLRSVSNFKTIYPTYDDFVNALVAGNLPVDFNGINEAGIQQVGTPLNKANLLADETAALLGLGQNDPTVNDALNVLANIGNVHVWQRVQTYADLVPYVDYLTSTDPNAYPKQSAEGGQDASYVLGDVVSGTIVPVNTGQVQFKYSTTVTVYDNGDLNVDGDVVNLQNYNTEGTSTIKGKYIVPVTTGASISGVWFIPSDATFSLISVDGNAAKRYLYCDKMQPVTGYPAIPANTVITYLGQLGEPGARIDVGSYVGTGTNGIENPCSISFNFVPKMVFLGPGDEYGGVVKILWPGATEAGSYYNNSSLLSLTWSNGNKTVSWYSRYTPEHQCNTSGKTYYVYAMV